MTTMKIVGDHFRYPFRLSDIIGGSRGGRNGRMHPPVEIIQFHAVFGKFWQNRALGPPSRGLAPNLGEILDPPLDISEIGYDLK